LAAQIVKADANLQELLAEAEYKPDVIWTREPRIELQLRIERWFYGFVLCALLTVILAALAGQTLFSGEAPLTTARRVWAKVFGGYSQADSARCATLRPRSCGWRIVVLLRCNNVTLR
jgi:hypothetical protein